MIRTLFVVLSIVFGIITSTAVAQVKNFTPVTQDMLLNPSPDDWLMASRTYDWQRFSPLKQINKQNAGQLRMAWARGMAGTGSHENIPIVHQGVMYVINPQSIIQALNATNGDLLWEYRRKLPEDLSKFINFAGRARTIAIYEDMVFYTAPDGYVVALDARTGALRWETKTQDYKTYTQHTAGPIVVNGLVITGRSAPRAATTDHRTAAVRRTRARPRRRPRARAHPMTCRRVAAPARIARTRSAARPHR